MKRLRRSVLSTPGSNPTMIAKAARAGADVTFVDLEDAVAPRHKVEARQNAIAGLLEHDWGRTSRGVRINATSTEWCLDDLLDVVAGAGAVLDVVIVPKVLSPRDVHFVDDVLTQLERKFALEPGRIGLEILIEEAEALSRIREIARSSPRLEALTLGVGDLAASLGMRLGHIGIGPEGETTDIWASARHDLIVAARAAGLDPIDGPYSDFRNRAGLEASAASFALLGGAGKWCIHPAQLDVVHRVFFSSVEEIAEARDVVDAIRAANERGEGAANVNGRMVDAATARIFESRLEQARQCGLT